MTQNEFYDIPTRIDIDAPERAEWRRDVQFHVGAWATWDDKTPPVACLEDFTELPTRELPVVDEGNWFQRAWRRIVK